MWVIYRYAGELATICLPNVFRGVKRISCTSDPLRQRMLPNGLRPDALSAAVPPVIKERRKQKSTLFYYAKSCFTGLC